MNEEIRAEDAAPADATRELRESGMLRPRRMLGQLAFFVIGAGLLGACVWYAFRGDDAGAAISRLREADPLLIMAMLGCTLISLLINGSTFWVFIRPVQALRWRDLQILNIVANALNYAPIRLGLIARFAYHLRVDGMSILRIGAWFGAMAVVMLMVTAVVMGATFLRPGLDVVWLGLLAVGIVVGACSTQWLAQSPMVARRMPGLEQMLGRGRILWAGIGLRLLDLSAYIGRAAAAAAIVGLPLGGVDDAIILGLVAFLAGLVPSRIGFREAGVALAAAQLATDAESLSRTVALFALVESAGEALLYVPGGAVGLAWFRARWRGSASAGTATA